MMVTRRNHDSPIIAQAGIVALVVRKRRWGFWFNPTLSFLL